MAFGDRNRSDSPLRARPNGVACAKTPPARLFSATRVRALWAAATLLTASNQPLEAQPVPETLRITTLRQEYERFLVEWSGGLPPYALEVSTDANATWTRISPLLRDNSFADLHIDQRPAGLYRVITFPDTTPPPQPTSFSAPVVKCDRAAFVWDPQNDDADGSGIWGYKIYRDGSFLKKLPAPTRYFIDESLLPSTNYLYQLSSVDSAGNESELSPAINVPTPDCISPSDTNLVVNIAWDRSEDNHVVGYLVYRGSQPGVYDWQIDVMQETTYSFDDLSPGVLYFISVTAYDEDGVESDSAGEIVLIP